MHRLGANTLKRLRQGFFNKDEFLIFFTESIRFN